MLDNKAKYDASKLEGVAEVNVFQLQVIIPGSKPVSTLQLMVVIEISTSK